MQLVANATSFRAVPEKLFLQQVWDIGDDELSKVGESANDRIYAEGSALAHAGIQTAKQGAAILEFQDLLDLPIPDRGEFFNVNYFFFEGANALRESVVSGLNGQSHASLAVLRSSFELFLLHAWWKMRRQEAESFEEFYGWIRGEKRHPLALSSDSSTHTSRRIPNAQQRKTRTSRMRGSVHMFTNL